MKDVEIEIVVKDENTQEVIVKRTSLTFESAGENLGKLERYIQSMDE